MKLQKPILHGRDHGCGGADPIPGICNLTHPTSGDPVPVLIPALGDLTLYYRMGESGSPLHDTSGYDTTDRYATLQSRPGASSGVAPTFNFTNPGLGGDDDGSVDFNYDQTVYTPVEADQPGWYFQASSTTASDEDGTSGNLASFNTSGGSYASALKSAMCFFKPKLSSVAGTLDFGPVAIIGTMGVEIGWSIGYDHFTQELVFTVGGVTGATGVVINGGSAPAGAWYHAAVTFDGSTYRLYLNGGLAGTWAHSAITTGAAFHIAYGRWHSGVYENDRLFFGAVDEVALYKRTLTAGEIAAVADAGLHGTNAGEGDVLTAPGDGGPPVWMPPKVGVGVNGGPATAPAPTPVPPSSLTDPPAYWGPYLDWINDQPFTYGGTLAFEVPPRTWVTIPFTTPLMERESTASGVAAFDELDWDDPDAGGWINPSDPHAIRIPHDMTKWHIQICLRIDMPPVQLTTTRRALRVLETNHQKPVLLVDTWRNTIDAGGGVHVMRGEPDRIFANGNPGGTALDHHPGIAIVPNDMNGTSIYNWLPRNDLGDWILKKGMRLVPQVWHDANVPLTFKVGGTYSGELDGNYRPHFMVFASMDRAWGPPWSTWPTAP